MKIPSEPWWKTDLYTRSSLTPPISLDDLSGPQGPAYVEVFDKGRTQPGWGSDQFMPNYQEKKFFLRRAQLKYDRLTKPHALVMRSVQLICIDVDGKNGGFASATSMVLPPTLAETSKSGNGYHLFYLVDDVWDEDMGFAKFSDRIAFKQGIDIRATGCVYHYPQQMWNHRSAEVLPVTVLDRLQEDRRHTLVEKVERYQRLVHSTNPEEQEELLVMQESITSRLTEPIPAGRRNNTLFALGAEMSAAGIPSWEEQIHSRAIEVGLTTEEAEKLVKNIRKYA